MHHLVIEGKTGLLEDLVEGELVSESFLVLFGIEPLDEVEYAVSYPLVLGVYSTFTSLEFFHKGAETVFHADT